MWHFWYETFFCARHTITVQNFMSCSKTLYNCFTTGLLNPRIVLEPTSSDKDMLSVTYLRAACEWENKYVRPYHKGNCSDLHSLHVYIRALNDKNMEDCSDISDADVQIALEVVRNCSRFYFDGLLSGPCDGNSTCDNVPPTCYKHGAVYKILHYLTDVDFLKDGDTSRTRVAYSVLYLRNTRNLARDIWRGDWFEDAEDMRDYYMNELDGGAVFDGMVEARAMNLKVSTETLTKYVIRDLIFLGIAMVSILILLFFYLRSVALMIAALLNVGFTIFVSYFLYMVVFGIPFFPFINIVAGLLLIAVTADGVFIMYDLKDEAQQKHKDISLEGATLMMLKHGGLSIFITGCTTAVAVFSNFTSNVTALRCFGIYGGTCVLVNVFFLLTFTPAVIIMAEKRKARNLKSYCRCQPICPSIRSRVNRATARFWTAQLPNVVTGFATLSILAFVAIGVAGMIIVFAAPKLEVQSEREYPIFQSSQPFERYRWQYREWFRFELEELRLERSRMNLQVVWGVDGSDNGNLLDPDDPGTLRFDDEFDLYQPDSQKFLRQFCTALLQQAFIYDSSNYECFFDVVARSIGDPCYNRTTCCELAFPMSGSNAMECLTNDSIQSLVTERSNKTVVGQAIYDEASEKAIAFRYSILTKYNWTNDYTDMKAFYKEVNNFAKDHMTLDGYGMNNGWIVGATGLEFDLYDLQDALTRGTLLGIALSIGVGFLVLLLTSLNIFITTYAMLTITLTIAVTMAALVLLGWEVTLFDSIVISLAVGLSIDFSIHYGIGYKLAPSEHRRDRVHDVLCTIGSAVAMAAVTTFGAGFSVFFAYLVAYQHFGTFLMIVMVISWGFATFFFLPVLSLIGPRKGFGDLIPCKGKRSYPVEAVDDKPTTNDCKPDGQPNGLSFTPRPLPLSTHSQSMRVKRDNRVSPVSRKLSI